MCVLFHAMEECDCVVIGHSAKYNITYMWLAVLELVKNSLEEEVVGGKGVPTVTEIFAIHP